MLKLSPVLERSTALGCSTRGARTLRLGNWDNQEYAQSTRHQPPGAVGAVLARSELVPHDSTRSCAGWGIISLYSWRLGVTNPQSLL
jgi:hypothetical protein